MLVNIKIIYIYNKLKNLNLNLFINFFRCADHYFNINGVANCIICSYLCGNCESIFESHILSQCLTCNGGDNRTPWTVDIFFNQTTYYNFT